MERSESVLVAFDVLNLDSLRWELSNNACGEEDDVVVRCQASSEAAIHVDEFVDAANEALVIAIHPDFESWSSTM